VLAFPAVWPRGCAPGAGSIAASNSTPFGATASSAGEQVADG